MKFKIPFTFSDVETLKKRSKPFISLFRAKRRKLGYLLQECRVSLTAEEYLGICLRNFFLNFIFLSFILTLFFAFLRVHYFYAIGIFVSLAFSLFILFSQYVYPRVYVNRKQKDIEKNLVSALEDMLIQLNSGIPLFQILVNISNSNYGFLSVEMGEAVKRINSGEPEYEVLDDIGKKNSSIFFRRALWQISNGMRAGSDIAVVINDIVKNLIEEQNIQIQNYGNSLNPLIVMYMLVLIIIPALSITFLTIISSMINLSKMQSIMMFIGIFIFDMILQIFFLGMIKTKRPSLL